MVVAHRSRPSRKLGASIGGAHSHSLRRCVPLSFRTTACDPALQRAGCPVKEQGSCLLQRFPNSHQLGRVPQPAIIHSWEDTATSCSGSKSCRWTGSACCWPCGWRHGWAHLRTSELGGRLGAAAPAWRTRCSSAGRTLVPELLAAQHQASTRGGMLAAGEGGCWLLHFPRHA